MGLLYLDNLIMGSLFRFSTYFSTAIRQHGQRNAYCLFSYFQLDL